MWSGVTPSGCVIALIASPSIWTRPTIPHGAQQLSFFNGHYDTWCYLPVMGFVSFNDEAEQYLCAAVLRPGNVTAAAGAVAILRRLVRMIYCHIFAGTDSGTPGWRFCASCRAGVSGSSRNWNMWSRWPEYIAEARGRKRNAASAPALWRSEKTELLREVRYKAGVARSAPRHHQSRGRPRCR